MCIITITFFIVNDAYTLPDTKTDIGTETDIETNKLAQNPMGICTDVCPYAVRFYITQF